MGCHTNILEVIEEIQLRRERKEKHIQVYIDFSSAYNTIDRRRLYTILKEKRILSDEEVNFLSFL